ncbi:MAG: tetratricopeptide repeat protein [Gammaproteobacteria bacterium]|nr:tetratricopeptide repeat protein [Gammaproteobacteria bacterium]
MTVPAGDDDSATEIRRIDGLLQRRQLPEARTLCDSLLMRHPDSAEGWLIAARISQQSGDYRGMLDAARRALALDPGNNLARFTEIEARMHAGDVAGARSQLSDIESTAGADSGAWRRLAEFHTNLNQHEQAATCAIRVAALKPYDAQAAYAKASALIAIGRMAEAEEILDELIGRTPGTAARRCAARRRGTITWRGCVPCSPPVPRDRRRSPCTTRSPRSSRT